MKYQKLSRRTALAAALAVAAAATVSAAELKPTEPDAATALPMAAQLETEVPNSREIGAADATLKLAKEDGRTEVWNVTLKNGQPITYTLNPDHCQDIEGNIVYSVNQR